ncbi:MAG: hypothetical protein WCP34_07485 [Pseudomonadota bacterium]
MRRSTSFVTCFTAASLSLLLTSLPANAENGRHNAFAMGAVAGAVLAPLLAVPRAVYSEPAVVYREPVVVHRAPRVVYEEVYEAPTYYRERRYYDQDPLPHGRYYSEHRHHRDYFDD